MRVILEGNGVHGEVDSEVKGGVNVVLKRFLKRNSKSERGRERKNLGAVSQMHGSFIK